MAGIDIDEAGCRLHYCKGEYFSLRRRRETQVRHLIYPVPPADIVGVGIHVTFDLEGRLVERPYSLVHVDSGWQVGLRLQDWEEIAVIEAK